MHQWNIEAMQRLALPVIARRKRSDQRSNLDNLTLVS